MKTAFSLLIAPTETSDCKTPTVAEELWATAVEKKPIKTPESFEENRRKSAERMPFSLRFRAPSFIVSIPTKRSPSAQRKKAALLNFSLFETKKINNGKVLPSEEKYRSLLSSVQPEKTAGYSFVSGTETEKKLSLSSVIPSMNGKLSLSDEDKKSCTVDYRGDGNGFFIEITLPSAGKENALLSSFASLPDWSAIAKTAGVSFSTVAYDKAVITAKVNAGRLDTFSVSADFTAAGTEGKTAFTIGGTLFSDYIFLWN